MTPRQFLESCGWSSGGSGNYYYPRDGYPHLHLGTIGVGMESGDIGNSATYVGRRAAWANLRARGLISFVAISNGGQSAGRNFISNGNVTSLAGSPIKHILAVAGGDGPRSAEMGYQLEHILRAYGLGLA